MKILGELVYLNGWLGPFEEAFVSINDRGYVFGDGIYEVIRVYDGKMFGLPEHLQRLEASAAAVEMNLPWDKRELEQLLKEVLQKSEIPEAMVYLQITRGIAHRSHLYEADLKPSLLITVRHVPPRIASHYEKGVAIVSRKEFRWQMCNVKSISLQAAVLAKNAAHRAGASEVVFVLPDNTVTECGASNIFIVKNGTILTHPANHRILAGITRQYVLELAKKKGLGIRIEPYILHDLLKADEVFFTGTVVEIVPVVKVDQQQIADGQPGPITQRLIQDFSLLTRAKESF